MTDPADEWVADGLGEFEGKKLVSVMRADLKLEGADAKAAETPEAWKPLFGRMRAVLQDKVSDVRVSQRLTDSPVCLVVPDGMHHAYVERVLKSYGRGIPRGKRILEVNPEHALLGQLKAVFEKDPAGTELGEYIEVLHDQALLQEGGVPPDPQKFARRLTALLTKATTG
jgi:molecular chaperone HtpG